MVNRTLVLHLASTNDRKYNIEKLLEEMFEVGEKLMKQKTKSEKYKPNDSDVIEELGDLQIRLAVVIEQYGLEAVQKRINDKSASLIKRADTGEYRGGL